MKFQRGVPTHLWKERCQRLTLLPNAETPPKKPLPLCPFHPHAPQKRQLQYPGSVRRWRKAQAILFGGPRWQPRCSPPTQHGRLRDDNYGGSSETEKLPRGASSPFVSDDVLLPVCQIQGGPLCFPKANRRGLLGGGSVPPFKMAARETMPPPPRFLKKIKCCLRLSASQAGANPTQRIYSC